MRPGIGVRRAMFFFRSSVRMMWRPQVSSKPSADQLSGATALAAHLEGGKVTILFWKLLAATRRKWRSLLKADRPSFAAHAIIQSLHGEASTDGAEREWRCRRAPAFVRVFGRAGRGRS
jgi:hypothetical protein